MLSFLKKLLHQVPWHFQLLSSDRKKMFTHSTSRFILLRFSANLTASNFFVSFVKMRRILSINDVTHFLRFLTPPFPLVTHFIKQAYEVTSPFGRSPSPPKWVTLFMDSPSAMMDKMKMKTKIIDNFRNPVWYRVDSGQSFTPS